MSTKPVAAVLPREVREALIAASEIADLHERKLAIEDVIERAKRHHPNFFNFNKEQQHG